jgi:hypothetical protein
MMQINFAPSTIFLSVSIIGLADYNPRIQSFAYVTTGHFEIDLDSDFGDKRLRATYGEWGGVAQFFGYQLEIVS